MKALIFDFDGVIQDTFEFCYSVVLSVYGEDLTRDQYRDFFNGNVYQKPEVTPESISAFFEQHNKAFVNLTMEQPVKSFLEGLTEHYPLFIITSNQENVLHRYFANNEAAHIFTDILGLETHTSKVEKFHMLFDKYEFAHTDCLFVTDTLGDILEAHEVGVKTIAVDFGFHERHRLEQGRPHAIVSSFTELQSMIKSF